MSGERSGRGWLVASVALNVFLAGGVAGGAGRWWYAEHSQTEHVAGAATSTSPKGLRFAADTLAPAQRQAFRTGLRDVRRASAELVQSSRDGRIEAARLLAAPTLDRAATDAALARARAADVAMRERVEQRVVDFAATLPPGDRATFVQGLVTQGNLRVPPGTAKPTPH